MAKEWKDMTESEKRDFVANKMKKNDKIARTDTRSLDDILEDDGLKKKKQRIKPKKKMDFKTFAKKAVGIGRSRSKSSYQDAKDYAAQFDDEDEYAKGGVVSPFDKYSKIKKMMKKK